jgi:type I restriction enzyme R subunit
VRQGLACHLGSELVAVHRAGSLYEPPFSNLHAGGPDELFAGKDNVITGIFSALKSTEPTILAGTG